MALKKRAKAPKYPQAQPKGTHKKSSMKKPKPKGIDPGNPGYGITDTTRGNPQARANSLFGNGSRNVPTGQATLTSKVGRQAY